MASIYDNIKTAKDLLVHVSIHGLSTKQEDICRAQDIFGNSYIEDLVELANDTGIKDGMSTGRKGTRDVFYQVLFNIWHWTDATRFYNRYTNPEFQKMKEQENKLKDEMREHSDTKKALEEQMKKTEEQHQIVLNERRRANDAEATMLQLEAELHDRDMKIMELKAQLYDYMMDEKTRKARSE